MMFHTSLNFLSKMCFADNHDSYRTAFNEVYVRLSHAMGADWPVL